MGSSFMDERYRKYEKLFALSFTAFVVAGGSAIFVIYDRVTAVSEKAEVVYALIGAVGVQVVFTTFLRNKRRFRLICSRVEKLYEIEDFGEVSNRLCVEIISKYRQYVVYMVVITFSVPLTIAAFNDVPLGDLRTLIIPSWYPWSTTTTTKYVLTIAVQVITMSLAYSLLISAVVFFSAAVMAIHSYFEILVERLPGSEIRWQGVEGNDSTWDGAMKELANHYRNLME